MLTFKQLSEKKTKVKINPKLDELKEKKGCSKCNSDCSKDQPCECECHMEKTPAQRSVEGKGKMTEAKKKDDTYLETDFKKRQKNNEKARKDLMKGPQMKNPHFEAKSYDPMEDPDFDHDEAERTRGQSGKNKSITVKKKTKKEEFAYVSQEEVSEESDQSIDQEETSLLTFAQFNEGRAEDAKKSLDAVKKRQGVLDDYEKKTGKKLDISKTPEHKQHKMRFPGAKRTGKKVKGAKETELQQHNRRVSKHNERLIKHGPTKKEAERQKGYDAYEKKHKRGNKSVWD